MRTPRHFLHLLASAALFCAAVPASAQNLTHVATYALPSQFNVPASNFHPQGLGYDPHLNELLFVQQNRAEIYRTDLTGNLLGSVVTGQNYMTGVAADASSYYFSDYTAHASGPDVFERSKTTGNQSPLGTQTSAFGGYPIDVRNGMLYRTNSSNSYDYSNLNTIRVSSLAAPDTILQTLTLNTPGGIGDFSVDTANSLLWVSQFNAPGNLYRYDLGTGALLGQYNLSLDGLHGGIAFANNRLYHYDHDVPGPNSWLRVYSYTPAAVPEPGTWAALAGIASVGGLALLRRRNRK